MKKLFLVCSIIVWSGAAFAASCSAGTTFDETFNSNVDPCFSGGTTVCEQTAIKSGAGSATVTTPPGSGWDNPNAMELVHGSTSPKLEFYGTIPYVSNSTAFTFCIELAYDSTTVTGFRNVFQLQNFNGTAFYYVQTNSSGSGAIYVNNSGTSCSLSINAHHVILVTSTGGSISTKIDGTTCGTTLTPPASQPTYLYLQGDTGTSAADWYFGHIAFSATGVPGNGPASPSSYASWAGATGGATVTNAAAAAGTVCGYNDGGTGTNGMIYTAGPTGESLLWDTSNTTTFPGNLSACGSSYAGNSGVSLERSDTSAVTTPAALLQYQTESAYANGLSIGYYWKVNTSTTPMHWMDMGNIVNGAFWHLCYSTSSTSCTNSGTQLYLFTETSGGTSANGTALTNNTWYYLSQECIPSGTDGFNVYSVSAVTFVPNTASPLLAGTTADTGCTSGSGTYGLGAVGSEAPGTNVTVDYSNVQFDFNHVVFPLLPPAAAAGGNAFGTLGVGAAVITLEMFNPLELINL
jgi:hypothetical protein